MALLFRGEEAGAIGAWYLKIKAMSDTPFQSSNHSVTCRNEQQKEQLQ